MERKKISNWEQLLAIMVGNYYEFNEIIQRVHSFKKTKNGVEVTTSTKTHFYSYEKIATVLYDFKPVRYNEQPPVAFMDRAVFVGEGIENSLITKLLPQDNLINALIKEMILTQERHKQNNEKLQNVMNNILEDLDNKNPPSTHLLKKAEIVSQFSRDAVSQELAELKGLMLLKSAIEYKNLQTRLEDSEPKQPPQIEDNKNENSSNYPQD